MNKSYNKLKKIGENIKKLMNLKLHIGATQKYISLYQGLLRRTSADLEDSRRDRNREQFEKSIY